MNKQNTNSFRICLIDNKMDIDDEYNKLSKPHESLKLIGIVMGITGGLPPLDNPTWDKVYLVYSLIIINTFGVLFVLSQFINLFFINDIELLADSSYLMFEQIAFCIKAFIVVKNWNQIRLIFQKLKSPVFCSHNSNQDYIVRESIRIVRRNSIAYYGIIFVGIIFMMCVPRMLGHKGLPLVGWFPFDTNSTANFLLVYLWQALGLTLCANLNGSMDMLSTGLMVLACGQLNVLSNSLENIRQMAIYRLQHKELLFSLNKNVYWSKWYGNARSGNENFHAIHFDDGVSDTNDIMEEDAVFKEVAKCVRHHYEILSLIEMIKGAFLNMVFVQFVGSVLVICVTTFEMSLMPFDNPKILGVVMYQTIMLQQLFLYCWYGNEVFYSSLNVFDAAYMSEWDKCGRKVRQAIGLIMNRAKHPILLKAGNFVSLKLNTFTAILRLSYSFYTLLQQARNGITNE